MSKLVSRVGGGEIHPDHIEVIQNASDESYRCRLCGEMTTEAEDCCGAGPAPMDVDLDLER